MKKSTSYFFTVLFLSLNFLISTKSSAQTASTTIVYSGFQACGGCTVCGADYYCFNTLSSYCGNTAACNSRNFTDPVPPGNIVTGVTINYFSAQCTGGSLSATINGNSVPTVNEGNTGCPCSASPCGQSAGSSNIFPCGLPGYNNGGTNTLQLCTGANVCINRLVIVLTYAPANQATPATTPTSVLGQTTLCPGVATTFSCPAVANASSYGWTFPAGWTVNSGGTTNVVNATPGSAGNVCVRAQNLCGNSAYTCIPVTLSTNSTPPTSASASPNPVCASASTTTLSLSGGSLGTGANWNWYSGSCGGTLVGTGSTITVSPSSTTTYYVNAVGTCNTTACTSVLFTVNPAPTANAGPTRVLTCANTSTTLSGSGGGTYSWTGPGIVSGGNTANPTINQPGTYSLVVTTAGCPSTVSTVNVTQNNTPPSVTGATSGSLNCAVTSVNVSASTGATPVSYNWSGTGITAGTGTGTITVNQPGTFNYTVTNTSNGCTTTGSQVVTQNTTGPAVTAATSGSLNCTSTSVNVSASTAATPVTYNWSGTGITAGTGTGTITVNQPGTFNYTVTNTSNGCTTTGSQVVSQNITPPAVTPAASGTLNCNASSVNVSANTAATPVSYNWSGTGITAGNGTGTITVNQPGTFNYTVTNTGNGCTTTGSQVVTQDNTPPAVTASTSGVLNCTLTSVNVSATTGSSPVSYNWTGPGITAGAGTGTISVNAGGTYNYTVTNTTNGCSTTGSQAVNQDNTAPAVAAASTGSLNCNTTSVNISATTTATPVSYNWSGAGITAGAGTGTISVNTGGTYNYTVTNTSNGCTTTGSQVINQDNTAPPVTAGVSGVLNCTATTIDASATTTSTPVSYTWTGPGITAGAGTGTVSVNQPGTYSYTVTNTDNGCVTTGSQAVTQNTTVPTVTMPATQTITCAAPSVTLIASATPANSNPVWTGGVSSGVNSYTATAASAGDYTLTVTDPSNGCTNSGTTQVVPSAGFPIVNTSFSNPITCVTTTAQVIATTTATPVSYSWTGPGVVSGAATSTADVNTGGQYTVVVQNTASMCSSTVTIGVPINTLATTPTISATGSITCLTPSLTISGSPASGVTYTWSGTGIIGGTNSQNADVNQGGVYTLSVTNSDGCVGTETVNVTSDNAVPSFTLGTASSVTTTCSNPTATLSASSSIDPDAVYTWITPTSSTLTGTPVTSSTAGIYTVVVTNTVNGCSTSLTSSQATVEVVADAGIPSVTLTANSVSITCANPAPSVTVSTTSSPVSYSWSPTSGIVPGTETTASPVFNAAGSYSVVVTNTVSGCATGIASNVVDVTLDNDIPVITLSATTNTGNITCLASSVVVTPTITPASGNLTYTWSPAAGISTPINQASATFTDAGVYTLAVTNTVTGCVSSATSTTNTFTVTLDNTAPTATITAVSSNTMIGCGASNATVTLGSTVNSTNATNLNWLPSNTSAPTLGVVTAGVYTLEVVDAVNGCSVTTQYTVTGSSTPPQNVDAGANAGIACGSSSLALTGTSTSTNVSYSWTGPTATSITSGSNTANPIVSEPGDYTLTVTDNATGCQSTDVVTVSQTNIVAGFTADPTSGLAPLTVNFTNTSTGASSFNWNFGDGNGSTAQDPSNVFVNSGAYTVVLTASSGTCVSTYTVEIIVNDGLTLEIPNVFTPNGDGTNDVFTIKSTGVKEITLEIFNRWGERLYSFSGDKAGWDGKVPSGAIATEGTYFYFVKVTGFDDKTIEKNGTMNLFR
jgi:gliding motility-associated-like protein